MAIGIELSETVVFVGGVSTEFWLLVLWYRKRLLV